MRHLTWISILVAIIFAGCELLGMGTAGIDDSEPHRAVDHGLEFLLEVPAEVKQHEPFEVSYHVINHRGEEVVFTTRSGCLTLMSVRFEGEFAGLKGTSYGCTAAITDWEVARGDTATLTVNARAELSQSGEPAPPGTYYVEAKPQIYEIEGDRVEELTNVQRSFEVIE